MLRGKDSEEDENFSIDFARKNHLKIEVKRFNVKAIAEKEKRSIEEVARKLRYQVFKEVKNLYNADKIATAHHMSDLAETMVMWFIQGNKSGMKGFKPIDKDIIRPLYYALKEEIENYAKKNKITYRVDISNLSTEFMRNKIRMEVLPILKGINPSLEKSLQIMSRFMFIDDDFFQRKISKLLKEYLKKDFLDLDKVKDPALLYRLLQLWVYNKTKVYMSYSTLLEVLKVIKKGGYKKVYISKEYLLEKEYNRIFIKTVKRSEKKEYEYKFRIGDTFYVEEAGIVINSYIAKKVDQNKLKNEKNMVCFDIPDLMEDENFVIRNRRKGDRFVPFGRSYEKKLKDVMIDLKIPKSMRDSIPLLVFRDKILWIVGYKRSAHYPVSDKSSKLVCFEVKEV